VKKFLALAIVALMTISLAAGCGGAGSTARTGSTAGGSTGPAPTKAN
jgi:uncharacterized protein YdeI (BOF family)